MAGTVSASLRGRDTAEQARELRVPSQLRNAASSTRLVYLLLKTTDEPLSNADLRDLTGLSAETTRRALRELARADMLIEASHPDDGRKCRYALGLPSGSQ